MAKKWTVRVVPGLSPFSDKWFVDIVKGNGEWWNDRDGYKRKSDALKAAKAITEAELVVKEDKKR